MKRRELIRHLETHGCYKLREGGTHTIYVNPVGNRTAAVPGTERSTNSWSGRFAVNSGFRSRDGGHPPTGPR
jgi:hypothetical protein